MGVEASEQRQRCAWQGKALITFLHMLLWCLAKYSATAAVRTYNLHSVRWRATAIWQGLRLISLESDYHFFSPCLSLTHAARLQLLSAGLKQDAEKNTHTHKIVFPLFKGFALPSSSNPFLGASLNSYQKLTNPPKLAGETTLTPWYQSHLAKAGLVATNGPSALTGRSGSAVEQHGLTDVFLGLRNQKTKGSHI